MAYSTNDTNKIVLPSELGDIHFAEEGVNILKGAAAKQSGVYNYVNEAYLATDGNNGQSENAEECAVTGYQSNPYLVVDIGKIFLVTSLNVLGATDCCQDNLDGYRIYIGNSDQYTDNPMCNNG